MHRPGKYVAYRDKFPVSLPDRTWPDRRITQAPFWCSVDLRDGNQALINPMNIEQKLEMYRMLLGIGFKEIEIGFPAASQIEYEFTRILIERNMIPGDVIPQVLTQARAHLIDRTFESLHGAKQAIVHMYNSTSELQRRVVFRMSKEEIIDLAVQGVKRVKQLAAQTDTKIVFQYSPESFTGTELDYAVEICRAVMDVWEPTPKDRMILNLPATVEMATPNVYADMIEWFGREIGDRESVIISLHTHNDRGTGVAASELGLLAGADRIEGTLFGNGERTGNVDIVTLALNMYTQGIDPKLDLHALMEIREVAERCTELPVHPRHPYAGDLVFSAFSGSHQDAIRKGFRALDTAKGGDWEVPYFIIDPADIGRKYEPIVRINSQSGKGGVAFIMHEEFGCDLPREMQPEFSAVIQKISEESGKEVHAPAIWEAFRREYLDLDRPYHFHHFRSYPVEEREENDEDVVGELNVDIHGEYRELKGIGNGPIDAAKKALVAAGCPNFQIANYWEHARSSGSDAEAVAYVQIRTEDGVTRFGVGIHPNTSVAAIKALLSGVNRAFG
ncbi:MAG: 2-isopropylmalate synthase [Armatimonadetes bacterium]|nr:2-isopropylmalate synthase [Armatimonadota bacterium]